MHSVVEAMAVDAVATSETVILFLPMKQLMHEKNAGYSWYGKMQANIIRMLSKKNLVLSNRIFCTTPKKSGIVYTPIFQCRG